MKKLNLQKMRNQRYRQYPLYEAMYVNRDDVDDIVGINTLEWLKDELLERFSEKIRRRRFYNKKPFVIESEIGYDIDFNRYRIVVNERWPISQNRRF